MATNTRAELTYTPLRHATLTTIHEGRVSRGLRPSGFAIKGAIVSSYGHMERTVSGILGAGLMRLGANWSDPATLTDLGVATLAEWDLRHPSKEG